MTKMRTGLFQWNNDHQRFMYIVVTWYLHEMQQNSGMIFSFMPLHGYIIRRHQMETFSVLLALCAGNSPVTGEFPAQRPVTRSLAVFFDLRQKKKTVE